MGMVGKKFKAIENTDIGIPVEKGTTIKIVRRLDTLGESYNFVFINITGNLSKRRIKHLKGMSWRICKYTLLDNFILLSNSIRKL